MRNGIAYLLPPLVRLTDAIECGSLPTPSAISYGTNHGGGMGRVGPVRPSLETMARKDLWPTPTSGDARSSGSRNTESSKAHPGISLTDAVRQDGGRGRMWPTATASDGNRGQNDPDGKRGQTLIGAARGQMWPTASARDWKDTPGMARVGAGGRKRTDQLARAVYATPQATKRGPDYSRTDRETSDGGTDLVTQIGGQLNPTWVEWLMGFPPGWTDCEASATRSSRRSRK